MGRRSRSCAAGVSREVARFIAARLLRAPADPPGWPGAAGLTDAVPALPHHQCLEIKQLARKGTGRPPACPARSRDVTFYHATAFGPRGNAGGRERGVRNGARGEGRIEARLEAVDTTPRAP